MITTWPGTPYAEQDKGLFDAWLLRNNKAIAYTDGDCVCTTNDYRLSDRDAVHDFADQYDCHIVWY